MRNYCEIAIQGEILDVLRYKAKLLWDCDIRRNSRWIVKSLIRGISNLFGSLYIYQIYQIFIWIN